MFLKYFGIGKKENPELFCIFLPSVFPQKVTGMRSDRWVHTLLPSDLSGMARPRPGDPGGPLFFKGFMEWLALQNLFLS